MQGWSPRLSSLLHGQVDSLLLTPPGKPLSTYIYIIYGNLWQLNGKESTCNAGAAGLIPGSGRSPAEGDGNPLQYLA